MYSTSKTSFVDQEYILLFSLLIFKEHSLSFYSKCLPHYKIYFFKQVISFATVEVISLEFYPILSSRRFSVVELLKV